MSHHVREVIGVDDRVSPARAIPLGIQHMISMFGSTVLVPVLTGLDPNVAIMCSGIGTICYLLVTGNKIPSYLGSSFSMFGSTVLVPVLTGLDPNVAIMCSGIGTICYLLVTGNKIPSYLGSSFAFISPIIAVGATQGLDAAMSGVIVAGAVFLVVAGIIKFVGTGWLDLRCSWWWLASSSSSAPAGSTACCRPCSSPRSWWSLAWGSRPPPQTWPTSAPTLREHRFSTHRRKHGLHRHRRCGSIGFQPAGRHRGRHHPARGRDFLRPWRHRRHGAGPARHRRGVRGRHRLWHGRFRAHRRG